MPGHAVKLAQTAYTCLRCRASKSPLAKTKTATRKHFDGRYRQQRRRTKIDLPIHILRIHESYSLESTWNPELPSPVLRRISCEPICGLEATHCLRVATSQPRSFE